MQSESLSLRFLAMALTLACLVWVVADRLIYTALYGDALPALALPYLENFAQMQRLDYRQFGGKWKIQDQALIQSNAEMADLFTVIPLSISAQQVYQFKTHLQPLAGPNGAGLLFNMQHNDTIQQSHLVRFGADGERQYLVFGYFDETGQFVEQGSLPSPDISQGVELGVIVYTDHYDLLINGQSQQQAIPLQYAGGKVALITWFSSVVFDDIAITPATAPASDSAITQSVGITTSTIPTPTPSITLDLLTIPPTITQILSTTPVNRLLTSAPVLADALLQEDVAKVIDSSAWTPLHGDWHFEAHAIVQQQAEGYDHSLRYAGRFSQFTLRVSFRHRQGIGGGVLFHLPDGATTKQGHLVRYLEGPTLVWGYFDAQGAFVGQGNAAVEPPGDQVHTLQIAVGEAVYSILLDDRVMAEKVPLVSPAGHIGLTASQSVVAFEAVKVILEGHVLVQDLK